MKDLPVPVYMYVQGVIARPLDPLSTRLAPIGDSPVYTRARRGAANLEALRVALLGGKVVCSKYWMLCEHGHRPSAQPTSRFLTSAGRFLHDVLELVESRRRTVLHLNRHGTRNTLQPVGMAGSHYRRDTE